MKAKLKKVDYEVLAAFRWSLRQFLRFSERAARQAGMTPQQHQALLAIKGFPGREQVSIGELSERLQIAPHSAVGLVDRLVSAGLLERARAKEDRRRVHLRVTARGEAMLGRLSEAHWEQLRRAGPQLRALLSALTEKQGVGEEPPSKRMRKTK